ncbi:hypothetical protein [Piscinibacterium candidicorallinum]|uniref:DUF1254 domain-containing protein n=1 Tax=Piscinibacterium candidicorallinum TaxID=1793872 RepID=A0ABV7H7U2_9BURK
MNTAELKQARWVTVKKVLFWATVPVLVVIFLTWRWYDARYPSWEEEVRLSDGRVITIKQKHDYIKNYGTRQSWVTFSLPEMGGKQTWRSYLIPMVIDVADGKVYAIGAPRGPSNYNIYDSPRYFLVAFEWNNGFQRIPFLSVPPALRETANVLRCLPPLSHRPVTIADKAKQWCDPVFSDLDARVIDERRFKTLSDKYAGNGSRRSE